MNEEAEVGLIVPRITQHFLAIFEYIPFAVRIPFAVLHLLLSVTILLAKAKRF